MQNRQEEILQWAIKKCPVSEDKKYKFDWVLDSLELKCKVKCNLETGEILATYINQQWGILGRGGVQPGTGQTDKEGFPVILFSIPVDILPDLSSALRNDLTNPKKSRSAKLLDFITCRCSSNTADETKSIDEKNQPLLIGHLRS